MREYRINGNEFTRASTLLAQAQELYASQHFAESYELVYNMCPGISQKDAEGILNGTIRTYDRNNTIIVFIEEVADE